jgi:hypothetical protein
VEDQHLRTEADRLVSTTCQHVHDHALQHVNSTTGDGHVRSKSMSQAVLTCLRTCVGNSPCCCARWCSCCANCCSGTMPVAQQASMAASKVVTSTCCPLRSMISSMFVASRTLPRRQYTRTRQLKVEASGLHTLHSRSNSCSARAAWSPAVEHDNVCGSGAGLAVSSWWEVQTCSTICAILFAAGTPAQLNSLAGG